MAHHVHEHRGTDLREPRPSKSRVGVSYESWRVSDGYRGVWVERRVRQPIDGLEGREERDDEEQAPNRY
jgi:hypothetical protein